MQPDVATVIQRSSLGAWNTDRSGDPLDHIFGWGLDMDRADVVIMRNELRRLRPRPPELEPSYLYPLKEVQRPGGYWEPPREHLPPRAQRRMAEAEANRATFLAALANGRTVKEACEAAGVSTSTYRQWRNRFPDFRLRTDRVISGLPESTKVDDSFVSRRRYYFGYETYTHHQRIISAIDDTPIGGVTIINISPESGKTTLLEDWCCDQIAKDPNVRILYCSETAEGHARKVLGTIKDRMTDPNREDTDAQYESHLVEWVTQYGPFRDDVQDKDKPWNQNYIKIHKASGRRDYTFQCVGWRSKIYGARCDYLVFDDVQSAESLNLTDKIVDRFKKTFFNRGRKGKIIFIGTRIGVGDVYERLIAELPDDMVRVVTIPALDEHGNSYCPEMWPKAALETTRRLVGEDGWTTAYMMAPQQAEATTFTADILDAARDPNRIYGKRSDNLVAVTIAGVDPALGGGNAVVVAETTSERFHVLAYQVDYGLARNEDIFAVLRSMCRYHYTKLVVETNSQQRGMARDDRLKELSRTFGFEVVEHETGANKWDYSWGVGAMAGSFIKGEVTFPDATAACREAMEAMRAELLSWRPNVPSKLLRQDIVMALWFPWLWWSQRRSTLGQSQTWKVGGTPWKPGDASGSWRGHRQRGVLAGHYR